MTSGLAVLRQAALNLLREADHVHSVTPDTISLNKLVAPDGG